MKISNLLSTLPLAVALIVGSSTANAADYLLVLDSSGSMQEATADGITKVDAAKQGLRQLKDDLAAHHVGIMLFGHTKNPKEAGSCEDIEFAVPIGPIPQADWDNVISRYVPKGSTPLAEALERSKYVMMGRPSTDQKYIVLVTDGNETCGGNPAAVAAGIRDLGINVITHVVGFGVTEEESKQLKSIASAGGGQYRSATNLEGLIIAFEEVTKPTNVETPQPRLVKYPPLSPIEKLLVDQLKDDNRHVRIQAVRTLQKRKVFGAVPALIECTSSDYIHYWEDKDVPLAAIKELAPERVVETILKARLSKTPHVRHWSVARLAEYGGDVPVDGLSETDQAIIDSLLKDDNRAVRNGAAKTLQKRKVVNAAPFLVQRIHDDFIHYYEDKDVPLAALKELDPSRVEEALIGAMQSTHPTVRTWAASRLVPDGN